MNRVTAERLIVAAFYVFLLFLWQLSVTLQLAPSYVLPSPHEVFSKLEELASDGMLWPSIRMSFFRMLIGFSVAATIGMLLGSVMGTYSLLSRAFKSLFLGLQTLPTAAWVPLSLLIYGLSDHGIWFVIIMSSFPAVAIATCDAIQRVPPIWSKVGKTFGSGKRRIITSILLPASLPTIITGLRLGWTLGWHGAVSAELIKSSVGLGFLLHMGRETQDAAQVVGIMLLTIFFGLLVDRILFSQIERRIALRWGLIQGT